MTSGRLLSLGSQVTGDKSHVTCALFLLVAGYWLLVTTIAPVFAEETQKEQPIIVNADEIEYFRDQHLVIGIGHCKVDNDGSILTADKMQVNTVTKDSEAWGHVELTRVGVVYRGTHGTYNFNTKEGRFEETTGETEPWYLAAKNVEKVAHKEKYIARRGYVTTCDHVPPHYRIAARRALIYPNSKVITENNTLLIGEVPVFWFPYFIQPLERRRFPISVMHGTATDWGRFLLTAYEHEVSDNLTTRWRVDWRQKRGVAYGLDAHYSSPVGNGLFRTYYLDDRLKHIKFDSTNPRGADFNRRTFVEDNNRYRFQLRHRWQVDPQTLVIAEYHKAADKDFIRDYFYQEEYQIDAAPQTYLSAVHTQDLYSLSFLLTKRVNKFESVTEQLPVLTFDTNSLRLGELPLYYSNSTVVGNHQAKKANSDSDDHVIRLQTDNTLSWAIRLPFGLAVSPSAGTKQSWYSTDLAGRNHRHRGAFHAGANMSMKFFKILTKQSMRPLGIDINGLRHVITPTAEYTYRHPPTVEAAQLPLDGVDGLTRRHTIVYGLENKLQTKRGQGAEGELETVDLARFLLSTDFLFRGREGELGFQSVTGDLEVRPKEGMGLEAGSTWSYRKRIFNNFNLDTWIDRKWMQVGAGYRWQQNVSTMLDLGLNMNLHDKWKFKIFERIQFKRTRDDGSKSKNNLLIQEYRIVRDLHCWEMEFVYNIDGTTMGRSFMLVFRPKAFPDLPFSFNSHMRQPKEGRANFVRE